MMVGWTALLGVFFTSNKEENGIASPPMAPPLPCSHPSSSLSTAGIILTSLTAAGGGGGGGGAPRHPFCSEGQRRRGEVMERTIEINEKKQHNLPSSDNYIGFLVISFFWVISSLLLSSPPPPPPHAPAIE